MKDIKQSAADTFLNLTRSGVDDEYKEKMYDMGAIQAFARHLKNTNKEISSSFMTSIYNIVIAWKTKISSTTPNPAREKMERDSTVDNIMYNMLHNGQDDEDMRSMAAITIGWIY